MSSRRRIVWACGGLTCISHRKLQKGKVGKKCPVLPNTSPKAHDLKLTGMATPHKRSKRMREQTA